MKKRVSLRHLLFIVVLIFGGLQNTPISASATTIQGAYESLQFTSAPGPPVSPVKLIFIHHSTGENWLNDGYGMLGMALANNNYFVSDTNYGWGPYGIGDRTDIPNWTEWFRSANTAVYMNALLNESGQNSTYTRLLTDPGGENEIILFKSCFPNSNLEGNPNDPPSADGWLTVGHAKYVYNDILQYFAAHPDKLFIVITAPPVQDATYAENARAFNQWLVNNWLVENNYTQPNVAVFDFYNVLTGPDNHHRYYNGAIEHVFTPGVNTLYYPSSPGDDHPNALGSQKATDEFVPLLNIYYNNWKNTLSSSTTLVNSVLPTSRTVPVGNLATIFNTVINAGANTASGITLSMATPPAGTFVYQQTDCATNAIIGSPNPSLDLPPGGVLCYVLSFTPSATFAATSVHIRAQAANAPSTNLLMGINTWLLRATDTLGPDIIALTTTTDFHQVSCSGANAFAVALSNVGATATGDITITANTGSATLPLSISISETDPGTGAIIGDNLLQNVGAGENRTVGVFVTFNGCVNFDPAANRIFIEFRDASNNVVGSTSTAVSTNR